MIDQSHNVTDPIESMLSSAEANDAMMGFRTLRAAYRTDVNPILAKAQERKPVGLGAGIV